MIHLHIDARYKANKFERAVQRAATATLQQQGVPAEIVELTIALTGDARLRNLNQQFRGVDAATDVLSFVEGTPDAESGRSYLGDIVISVMRARAQAAAAGHPLPAELQLLTVHGVLHLLGHDHATSAQRRTMWAAQDAILHSLGLHITSAEMETRPEAK